MEAERLDYLTTQYVWSIQNESAWSRYAAAYVRTSRYDAFYKITVQYIVSTSRAIMNCGEIFITPEKSEIGFIAQTLWEEMGGVANRIPNQYRYDPAPTQEMKALEVEIESHVKSAATHFAKLADNLNQTLKENHTMQTNQDKAFEIKTVIFGKDASLMSEEELIAAIKHIEGSIAKLKEVKTASKKIAANIEALEEDVQKIVSVLDTRA